MIRLNYSEGHVALLVLDSCAVWLPGLSATQVEKVCTMLWASADDARSAKECLVQLLEPEMLARIQLLVWGSGDCWIESLDSDLSSPRQSATAWAPGPDCVLTMGAPSDAFQWPIRGGLVWASAVYCKGTTLVGSGAIPRDRSSSSADDEARERNDAGASRHGASPAISEAIRDSQYASLFSGAGPAGHPAQPSAMMPDIGGNELTFVGNADDVQPPETDPEAPTASEQLGPWLFIPGIQPLALDKPVLVGRKPVSPEWVGSDVRLLYISSELRNISSTHAMIEYDAMGAWVTDLHSTNGTQVVWPDSPPERLVPGVRTAVKVGCVIDLGDGVALRLLASRPEGSSTSPQQPTNG